jgi:hypothetical protein
MIATHNIQDITFDQDLMFINIDGKLIKIPLDKVSSKLKRANEVQRNLYKISPSGYGIHWPLIDENLAIDSLLKFAI